MTRPTIESLELAPFIKEALGELGFSRLTPVQEAVIPYALKGRNLIVQSQTGSGKSHSFLIPIFQQLDPSLDQVQVVITAPSRELAMQLYQAAKQLASTSPEPLRVVHYMGGQTSNVKWISCKQVNPKLSLGRLVVSMT